MTTPADEITTAQLLLAWDQGRARSMQREIGWSEIGGCRRRAGYRMAGTEPTNPGSSVQAVMGTAIHSAVQDVLRDLAQPGDMVEEEVRFAGILGHFDRYEAATQTLIDVKTTSSRWLKTIKRDGPPRNTLWQINGYAASLVAQGTPVKRVVLDYLARDTGEEHRWEGRPDPQLVREALAWLAEVKSTDVAWLPRDYEPDSAFCKHCPFRDTCWPDIGDGEVERDRRAVLFQENPDAKAWAEKLDQARADKAEALKREKEAKGALDALRPNISGTAAVDVGYGKQLQWTVSTVNKLDGDQVRADYQAAGTTAPTKQTTTVTLNLVAPQSEEDAA